MSTDTRQALAALLPCPFCGNYDGLAVANENPHDLSGGYFIACPSCDASTGLRFACGEDPTPLLIEQWNRRAALAAQPVAGAVAEPCNLCNALTVPRNATHYDAEDLSAASVRAKLMHKLIPVEAAPAPEPSAQAVAHPSHQTVREWMPVSEALRLSDLWTAGDLDNCGQWRAAIKVLADEVRALAASPQPAEPSAQGEPVAWRPGDPIYDDAYVRGVAVGFAEDDSRRTTLLRIADRIEARASAPSTPPHAVVEAETNAWPIERAADMLTAYAELVKATGRYAEEHYIPEIENVAAELRGIAPKAAQEKT